MSFENQYDPNAHTVWMPQLETIPVSLRTEVTRPEKKGSSKQTVQDTAGKMVGRVPANLGKLFKDYGRSIISIKRYITKNTAAL